MVTIKTPKFIRIGHETSCCKTTASEKMPISETLLPSSWRMSSQRMKSTIFMLKP